MPLRLNVSVRFSANVLIRKSKSVYYRDTPTPSIGGVLIHILGSLGVNGDEGVDVTALLTLAFVEACLVLLLISTVWLNKDYAMSDHHTYKKLEIVGSSPVSSDDAIRNALSECSKSIRNIDWFEVVETRGHVENGQVGHFQVTLKIGFRIEDS